MTGSGKKTAVLQSLADVFKGAPLDEEKKPLLPAVDLDEDADEDVTKPEVVYGKLPPLLDEPPPFKELNEEGKEDTMLRRGGAAIAPPSLPGPPKEPPPQALVDAAKAAANAKLPPPPPPLGSPALASENLIEKIRKLINEKRFGDVPGILESEEFTTEMLLEKKDGQTLLHSLIQGNHLILFKEILKLKKCTPEVLSAKDANGNTVVHIAAAANFSAKFLQPVLSCHACTTDVLLLQNNERDTALHIAVNSLQLESVQSFLNEPRCDESVFAVGDKNRCTVLHRAVTLNNNVLFYMLLRSGRISDRVVNRKNISGQTALYQAMDLTAYTNAALVDRPIVDINQARLRLKMVQGFVHLKNLMADSLEFAIPDIDKTDVNDGYQVLEKMLIEGDHALPTTDEIKKEIARVFINIALEDLLLNAHGLPQKEEIYIKPRILELCDLVKRLPLQNLPSKDLINIALTLKKTKEMVREPAKHLEDFISMVDKVRHINRSWSKVLVGALMAVATAAVCTLATVSALAAFGVVSVSSVFASTAFGVYLANMIALHGATAVGTTASVVAPLAAGVSVGSTLFAIREGRSGALGQSADKVQDEVKKLIP